MSLFCASDRTSRTIACADRAAESFLRLVYTACLVDIDLARKQTALRGSAKSYTKLP